MNTSIESAFASTYADDRIRQAAASRQARDARRDAPAGTPKRRWFTRSRAIAAPRPVHSGR